MVASDGPYDLPRDSFGMWYALLVAMSTDATVTYKVVGYRESVYQACPGAHVQPGGCCENCGQGIRYVVTLKSSDGRRLDVGRDCAETLVGGEELREIRRAEREWEREQYLKSPEYAARCAREAQEKAEREVRRAAAKQTHALTLAGLQAIIDSGNCSRHDREAAASYRNSLLDGNDWPARDVAALSLAARAAYLPASRHVGTVGQRYEAVAVLEAFIPVDSNWGRSYVQKYRTDSGAVLVWFSAGGEVGSRHIGCRVGIRGTVKAHKSYMEQAETTLSRCKTTEIDKPEEE